MNEVRTRLLDQQAKIDLCQLSRSDAGETIGMVQELLPRELTPEEIDSVGQQVSGLTELIAPSRDGYSRGKKAERDVVRMIGFVAAVTGDTPTAESAIAHLQKDRSIVNRLATGLIRRELRRPPIHTENI